MKYTALPYLTPDQKIKLSHINNRSCLYKNTVLHDFDGEAVALSFDPYVEQ